jgi:tRNA(His) 5'-end guanylyltransferase
MLWMPLQLNYVNNSTLKCYTQSDEISLIFTNIDNINSDLIYDGKIQKIASITAGKLQHLIVLC